MPETLRETGIIKEALFHVKGDLVENYNRVLETAIGKRTALSSFHIDKRGESAEIEEELGKNYLQAGPAHRYCIVISPDQKDAGLLHEEFSFDHEVLDFLYQNYLSGISIATRVDSLYGELDDDVREYETLEDLLLIKRVQVELHTPSDFLTKARQLQKYVAQLQKNPELLIKNNSALPRRILELVSEVGDVRNYNLGPIRATKELTTFYTRLFGGVCVFRDFDPQNTFQMKRPDEEPYFLNLSVDALVSVQNISEDLPDQKKISSLSSGEIASEQRDERVKTVVIYQQKDYQPEDGPVVKFIPLQDKERVIQFLVENGRAGYSYRLLDLRLSRLEDETLVGKGYDVTHMGKEQRTQLLHECREHMLLEWYDLKDIKRAVSKGHELPEIIHKYSPNVKSLLLKSIPDSKGNSNVVDHLLTRLCHIDYEKMYDHNRRHLENIYAKADENTRKYILQVLTEMHDNRSGLGGLRASVEEEHENI